MRAKYRKYVSPMEPDMATARIRGVNNLFRDGATSEAIWGYAATGQVNRGGSPFMLGDWDAAMNDFDMTFPDGATRDQAKAEAIRRLRSISLTGVA